MNAAETGALVAWVRALSPVERTARTLSVLASTPLFDLEVMSGCNVSCAFCPRASMRRQRARMSERTFDATQAMLPSGAVVMISGLGEALLHPRLPVWVSRLRRNGHSTCVVTNAQALTPQRLAALIAAGIEQIQVSVHALAKDDVYALMGRGTRPRLMQQHLEHLARSRPESLRVRVNFVATPTNGTQVEAVATFAQRYGFEFYPRREHVRGGSLGCGRIAARDEGCGIFAAVTFISSDGLVLPCVNDVRGEGALGNVGSLGWDDVIAWKQTTIVEGGWFDACASCDDDYRWVILGQHGVDEPR